MLKIGGRYELPPGQKPGMEGPQGFPMAARASRGRPRPLSVSSAWPKMAAPPPPVEASSKQPFLGLLSGVAQAAYYGHKEVTEGLLREQLYPDMAPQEFAALRAKAAGLLKSIASADMDTNQLEAFLTAQTKKPGGITSDQAAVIAKFWRNHRMKIRDNLINQSKWENSLKNLSWRVDFKSQSRNIDQLSSPVAIVEMELRKNGQESEFLTVEFDEMKLNQMVKKLSEIEDSITSLTQAP